MKKQINGRINEHKVFIECGVSECKDMNEVLMRYKGIPISIIAHHKEPITNNEFMDKLTIEQRENFEERAAIMEFDGGLTQEKSEESALIIYLKTMK